MAEIIVNGNKIKINNYYAPDDTVPTTFSSRQSLGPSLPITIDLENPINSFSIKANELDDRESVEVAVKYDNKDFYTVKGKFYAQQAASPLPREWALGLYTRIDPANREVIYSKTQLQEKQRKLQIIVDAFTQTADFGRRGGSDKDLMKSAVWPFALQDFPAVAAVILEQPRKVPLEAYFRDSYRGAYAQLGRDALASAIFTEYTGTVAPRSQFKDRFEYNREILRARAEIEKTLPSVVKGTVFRKTRDTNDVDYLGEFLTGDNTRAYFEPTFNDKKLGNEGSAVREYFAEIAQVYIDLINDILRASDATLSRNLTTNIEETKIEAFDTNGNLLRSVAFTAAEPTITINKAGIKTVKLTPIQGDYIFFSDMNVPLYVPPPTPTPTPLPEPKVFTVSTSILINILPVPQQLKLDRDLVLRIIPEETPVQSLTLTYPFTVTTNPTQINITEPIVQTALGFIDDILAVYINEDLELKTLLNYGNDKQSVILNQRPGNINQSIQLKLLQPVPDEVKVGDGVLISREVAKTVVDKFRVRYAPPIDNSPYLRPLNTKVKVDEQLGNKLRNMTLNKLEVTSGSIGVQDVRGNISFEDEIFRKWYSYDFNSSELNIDFSDYKNFVFYSSATARLESFKQKLLRLESINKWQQQFVSASFTGSIAYAGSTFVQAESAKYSLEKENIIRNFDRYEQYLYFTTGSSAYSASVDYQDVDGETEYNSPGYWPKLNGMLYSVTSSQATTWYDTQLSIAQRYDEFNVNNLINTIPSHIRDDEDSQSYVTFVSMIGHLFDNIKLYVDQFPRIYDRQINPNDGLSKDLINEVAESFGFKLPALNTLYSLSDNIIGTNNEAPRRDYTVEAYKRLLHHLPLFAKAKGTRYALETLLRTLGISPEFLSVKEAGTPTSSSFKTFEEYSTGLDFDVGTVSYVKVPLSSSISASVTPARTPKAIQFNAKFNPLNATSSVLTGDGWWGLHAVPHPDTTLTEYGRFILRSGSVNILSSSYLPIFTNELINVTLQYTNDSASLQLIAVDGEYTIFNETYTQPMGNRGWNDAQYVYVGGSGSAVLGRFDGLIDEFRLWGDTLTQAMVETNAFDPGSNAGDLYDDATNYLYVQLSFNKIDTNIITGSLILNESPYLNKTVTPQLAYISASTVTTASFSRYSRTVRQVVPEIGGLAYVTNKVQILNPPVFNPESLDKNGVKTLNLRKSIVSPNAKGAKAGKNQVIISVSPTEFINQNIVRNLGLENINSVLGLPSGYYTAFPTTLQDIKSHYEKYYYAPVNINQFIRVLSATTSVLNQILDYFIPSRASVLKGIVIEPNILEKPRISLTNGIKFYGKQAKRTNNAASSLTGSRADYHATFNLQKTIKLEENYVVTGSKDNYKGLINTEEVIVPTAKYNKYVAELTSSNTDMVLGRVNTYKTAISESTATLTGSEHFYSYKTDIDISPNFPSTYDTKTVTIDSDLNNTNKVPYNSTNRGAPGAEPYNRLYSRKLYYEEIQKTRFGGTGSLYVPALKEIPPTADLRDYGVRTFFNDPDGVYLFPTIQKLPVFPKPINYSTATTWSYGERYNLYDVVYQAPHKTGSADTRLGDITGSAAAGNYRYYVFTTRPSYVPPTDGTSYYSGSVPTYIPPSLDRRNWQLLKFKPVQVRKPKRVVYDLFTVRTSTENNYKTTILPITTVVDIPTRAVETFTVGSLLPGEVNTGQLTVQNIALLFALQTTSPNIRVRFYASSVERDADIARPIVQPPMSGEGVLLDTILYNSGVAMRTLPLPVLATSKQDAVVYYTVDNLGTSIANTIKLSLYYFTLELQPRIPFGYLRKHYRFFRDNSTATKRRNYEGCKFNIIGYSSGGEPIYDTIDGLPPVQIFVSEGTSITVSSARVNEIVTGGGGQLNVT